MFGDYDWESARADAQHERMRDWLDNVSNPVVIELGAGTAVPTARMAGESLGVPMIRINPGEAGVRRPDDVSIRAGALEAVAAIAHELGRE